MTSDSRPLDHALALALFSRQFGMLLGAGVSLLRCLYILEHEAPPPFADLARELRTEVEARQFISQAMESRPQAFSRFYVKMVRVGETGGVLDEVLIFLAEALEQEWRLSRYTEAEDWRAPLLIATGQPTPHDWAGLDEHQRQRILLLFCWSLSTLLSAGVPMSLTLETAADLLPDAQREAVRALAKGDLTQGITQPLSQIGFLPVLVTELLSLGEKTGLLHQMLDTAAQIYRHELECALMARHSQRNPNP